LNIIPQVSLLSLERRRAMEEQIRLHSLCRVAEADKHNAIMQAEVDKSESLKQQLVIASSSFAFAVPKLTSTASSVDSLLRLPT